MSFALDTNILARSIEPDHPMHTAASVAIDVLVDRGEDVCLLAQSLYEFWVIATRPRASNGLGLSATEAQARLDRFQKLFTLKTDRAAIY
ncbi:MAG: PIN domain nuclease, partial [Acidobacteriota bacterium]|nr:PIN domain nuclease [Acidobacteriota bacterium]